MNTHSNPVEVPDTWAVVELMGHVKLAGRLTEEEKFGAKMGRLDIPNPDQSETSSGPFITRYFGGSSVYSITFVSEAVARQVAKGTSPEPVHSWDFPKQLAAKPQCEPEADDDEDDHDELATRWTTLP